MSMSFLHFSCNYCNFIVNTQLELDTHKDQHMIKCFLCIFSSVSESQMKRHVRHDHHDLVDSSITDYSLDKDPCSTCVYCGFMTYSTELLQKHTTVRHKGIADKSVSKFLLKCDSAKVRQTDALFYIALFCETLDACISLKEVNYNNFEPSSASNIIDDTIKDDPCVSVTHEKDLQKEVFTSDESTHAKFDSSVTKLDENDLSVEIKNASSSQNVLFIVSSNFKVKEETIKCLHCPYSNMAIDDLKNHMITQHPIEAAVVANNSIEPPYNHPVIIFFCVKETCNYSTAEFNIYEGHIMSCCLSHHTLSEFERKRLQSSLKFILDFHKNHSLNAVSGLEDFVSSVNNIFLSENNVGKVHKDQNISSMSDYPLASKSDVRPAITYSTSTSVTKSGNSASSDSRCVTYDNQNVPSNLSLNDANVDSLLDGNIIYRRDGKDSGNSIEDHEGDNVSVVNTPSEHQKQEAICKELPTESLSGQTSFQYTIEIVEKEFCKVSDGIRESCHDIQENNAVTESGTHIMYIADDDVYNDNDGYFQVGSGGQSNELENKCYTDESKEVDENVNGFNTELEGSYACWKCFSEFTYCLNVKTHIIEEHSEALCAVAFEDTEIESCHNHPQILLFCPKSCKYVTSKLDDFSHHIASCQKPQLHNKGQDILNIESNFFSNDYIKLQQNITSGRIFNIRKERKLSTAVKSKGQVDHLNVSSIGCDNQDQLNEVCLEDANTKYSILITQLARQLTKASKETDGGDSVSVANGTNAFSQSGSMTVHAEKESFQSKNFDKNDDTHSTVLVKEKQFKCQKCGKRFGDRRQLSNHIRVHTGERPFKCTECEKSFRQRSHLLDHVNTHRGKSQDIVQLDDVMADTGEESFQCKQCGRRFDQNDDLHVHMRIHMDAKPFECQNCGKGFGDRRQLSVHMRIHTGERPFKCKECGRSFRQSGHLTDHMNTHREKKRVKSNECDETFSSERRLIKHLTVYTGEKESFISDEHSVPKEDLLFHMETHSEKSAFNYSECEEGLTTNDDLNINMKTKQENEEGFECDGRSEGLSKKENLNLHMKVHTIKKSFTCPECDKTFSTKHQLDIHLRIHTGEKPSSTDFVQIVDVIVDTGKESFQCKQCSERFDQIDDLRVHMKTHMDEKPFECQECGKGFGDRRQLSVHMRIHTGERPFKCEECGRSFRQSGHLTDHMNTHREKKLVKCSQCHETFSSERRLIKHMTMHAGEKKSLRRYENTVPKEDLQFHLKMETHSEKYSLKCIECKESFTSNDDFIIHMKTIHKNEEVTRCGICGKDFDNTEDLNLHMTVHTIKKPFKCPECHKTLSTKRQLDIHLRIHTGEKPYTCNVCGKNFRQNSHLYDHVNYLHSKKKKFKCDECDKTFSHPHSFRRHMKKHQEKPPERLCEICNETFSSYTDFQVHVKTHTEKRPFKCNECPKAFSSRQILKTHIRTHTGERPFKCDECGQSFRQRAHLYGHQTTHKKENVFRSDLTRENFQIDDQEVKQLQSNEFDKSTSQNDDAGENDFSHDRLTNDMREDAVPLLCHECGKEFLGKQSLSEHMIAHTEEKPYKCNECGKRFTCKYSLSCHKIRHRGVKYFLCNDCGKSFYTNSSFKIHMRIHTEEKPFKCIECPKSFRDKRQLTIHTRVHTGERPYSCTECGKKFRQRCHLTDHIKTHSKKEPCICEVCGKSYAHSSNLRIHMHVHTGEKRYTCYLCDENFTDNNLFLKHKISHSKERPFKCNDCGKAFNYESSLIVHLRLHSGETSFKCEICSKTYSSAGSLRTHIRTHINEKSFMCDDCGKSFCRKDDLRKHKTIHSDEKIFSCDQCGKNFRLSCQLKKHKRRHTNERPFLCNVCGKFFRTIDVLLGHKKIHTGEKAFKCELCSFRCIRKYGLNRHMRTHTGEKPFQCHECGKSFSQESTLHHHAFIHTGEKPFACQVCNRRFRMKEHLKTHMKIHRR